MKCFLSASMLVLISACSSLPKGNHELKQMINDDLPKTEDRKNTYIHKGRPIYLEAQSYPQIIEGGHISMGGKVYVFAGREELALADLIKYQSNSSTETEIIPDTPIQSPTETPAIESSHNVLAEKKTSEETFPITPGTKTLEDVVLLKNSSIKKKDMVVVNHLQCAKPIIEKNGNCNELKVIFDLSLCVGEKLTQDGFQVSCNQNRAVYGVKKNNVRYRATLLSSQGKNKKEQLWTVNKKIEIMFIKPGNLI